MISYNYKCLMSLLVALLLVITDRS